MFKICENIFIINIRLNYNFLIFKYIYDIIYYFKYLKFLILKWFGI